MKKKDHLPYTNIVGKKRKKKSNGIDSVQPQKIMSIYFDRLYSHIGQRVLQIHHVPEWKFWLGFW